jgi:hypothetical protein
MLDAYLYLCIKKISIKRGWDEFVNIKLNFQTWFLELCFGLYMEILCDTQRFTLSSVFTPV